MHGSIVWMNRAVQPEPCERFIQLSTTFKVYPAVQANVGNCSGLGQKPEFVVQVPA